MRRPPVPSPFCLVFRQLEGAPSGLLTRACGQEQPAAVRTCLVVVQGPGTEPLPTQPRIVVHALGTCVLLLHLLMGGKEVGGPGDLGSAHGQGSRQARGKRVPTQLPTQHSSACQMTYRTGCPDLKQHNTRSDRRGAAPGSPAPTAGHPPLGAPRRACPALGAPRTRPLLPPALDREGRWVPGPRRDLHGRTWPALTLGRGGTLPRLPPWGGQEPCLPWAVRWREASLCRGGSLAGGAASAGRGSSVCLQSNSTQDITQPAGGGKGRPLLSVPYVAQRQGLS